MKKVICTSRKMATPKRTMHFWYVARLLNLFMFWLGAPEGKLSKSQSEGRQWLIFFLLILPGLLFFGLRLAFNGLEAIKGATSHQMAIIGFAIPYYGSFYFCFKACRDKRFMPIPVRSFFCWIDEAESSLCEDVGFYFRDVRQELERDLIINIDHYFNACAQMSKKEIIYRKVVLCCERLLLSGRFEVYGDLLTDRGNDLVKIREKALAEVEALNNHREPVTSFAG